MATKLSAVRVLTVHQPWAWAIVHGLKTIENRTWYTHYRGPLWIHASKSERSLHDPHIKRLLPGLHLESLTFGAILGCVQLIECVAVEDLPSQYRRNPHAEGPYCWITSKLLVLKQPIIERGRQGLWKCSMPLVLLNDFEKHPC